MTKIVHLTTVHPPFDIRIFHKECKTLARAGYTVSLIAQHEKDEIVEGINIIALPKPCNRLQRIFSLTWTAFQISKKENAAIYHFHDPELIPIGLLLKILTKGKVIYDAHEDISTRILQKFWLPNFSKKVLSQLYSIFERICTNFIDSVITSEDDVAKKLMDVSPTLIYNYPDINMFTISPQNIINNKENGILYIGGISKIRGAFQMVKVLEFLNPIYNIHLHLIGPPTPENIIDELKSLPGYNYVSVYGRLDIEDAIQYAQKMKIGLALLHPIPNYVFLPTKLFEYMIMGIPVIVSNVPLWRDIVEINHCGIAVDPYDLSQIASAIEYLLSNPKEARKMGENGRRAVIENYNWENEGKKLIRLYEELLNS